MLENPQATKDALIQWIRDYFGKMVPTVVLQSWYFKVVDGLDYRGSSLQRSSRQIARSWCSYAKWSAIGLMMLRQW